MAGSLTDDGDGGAYGRAPHTHDAEITEVGPGTPCGELMRRYWHPIELSERLGERPIEVRVLGEDLVLFRDLEGRPGLITPRCIHRGAPMSFAKVEARGIRCPYHGWLFDTEGRCLDQPCEVEDKPAFRARCRQPWYPVEERYGLVFAYLGPPEKKPILPRWAPFEEIAEGEKIVPDAASYSVGGDDSEELIPWNWLQDWENTMDPFHVVILHTAFSGPQFNPDMAVIARRDVGHHPARDAVHRPSPSARRKRDGPRHPCDVPQPPERAQYPAQPWRGREHGLAGPGRRHPPPHLPHHPHAGRLRGACRWSRRRSWRRSGRT